jgi:hypothetical protein
VRRDITAVAWREVSVALVKAALQSGNGILERTVRAATLDGGDEGVDDAGVEDTRSSPDRAVDF